jgi:hypothetical protein
MKLLTRACQLEACWQTIQETADPFWALEPLRSRSSADSMHRLSRRLGGKRPKIIWQQFNQWCVYPHIRKGIEQAVISKLGKDIKPVQMVLISVASSRLGLSDEYDKSGPHKSASDENNNNILLFALLWGHNTSIHQENCNRRFKLYKMHRTWASRQDKPEHQRPLPPFLHPSFGRQ